jgi:uncharacterized damage-inducible protein DinB
MSTYGAAEMAESFRTVRKNTIQVAEDIPEDQYGFRAAEGTMSVGEMLAHLAASTHWAEQLHMVERKQSVSYEDFFRYNAEVKQAAEALTTKRAIIDALVARGESFASKLASLTDEELNEPVAFPPPVKPTSKSRFDMLLSVKEHEMHHRGQLMLMERILGIVPHLTRQRQQRSGSAQDQAAKA